MDRFWAKVEVDPSGCWLWTAGKLQGRGYGRFAVGGTTVYAHRFAYELLVATIPAGMTIDHLCMNQSCVNPIHMEVVTRAENQRRGKASILYCPQGHPYTEDNTYRYPNGARSCRTCRKQRSHRKAA